MIVEIVYKSGKYQLISLLGSEIEVNVVDNYLRVWIDKAQKEYVKLDQIVSLTIR
jgi:hypothetical protein